MKSKVIISPIKISPHGGIVPILEKIKTSGLRKIIRTELGTRAKQAYQYDEVFLSWILTSLCGGFRIDHLTKIKEKLSFIPGLDLPSHDTIGRAFKSLATKNDKIEYVSKTGKKARMHLNEFNENEALNRMLIRGSKQIGALKVGKKYTLHIDATFLETNCRTSNIGSIGNKYGFYPMICLIDDMPVYISMRNGDVNALFQVKDCLERCLTLLKENGITVDRVISDGAGYTKEMIEYLNGINTNFNIHMPLNTYFKRMLKEIDNCQNWTNATIETANNIIPCEVGNIDYNLHESQYINRIVLARIPTENTLLKLESPEENQRRKFIEEKMKLLSERKLLKSQNRAYKMGEWKEYNGYLYKLIITNDTVTDGTALIHEYNKRGDAERKFDFMKNDFGWRLPPFMKMNENTVFLVAAALANNVYRGVLRSFSKLIHQLRNNMRLREFRFVFISVSCEYRDTIDTWIFYDTKIDFQKIM